MEMQDTYIRLDRSIATLLELIDKQVGLQNTIVCITSTGYADPEPADTGIYRIPGGEFHLNRCATLLNMYLMATYGAGQYVEAYYDQQIYLNHKLLEDKQLDLTDILENRQPSWCSSAAWIKSTRPTSCCSAPGLPRLTPSATAITANVRATWS